MDFNAESPVAENDTSAVRHDWTLDEVLALFRLPFNDLLYRADGPPRDFRRQRGSDLDLALDQDGRVPGRLRLLPAERPLSDRRDDGQADGPGDRAGRGASGERGGRDAVLHGGGLASPRDSDVEQVAELVEGVKALDLETCATLGMLTRRQADRLKDAGLDFYNHNLDTSASYYGQIIRTRTLQDRLETLEHVRAAGMHVCCGGILGMGEGLEDRAELLRTLANLPEHPESVPINQLVRVEGTPLAGADPVDPLDFVRTIAVARILMPRSVVRLSAGRESMSDELQALCFLAGANSIFYGEKLLTTPNPATHADRRLFDRLGLRPMAPAPCDEDRLPSEREAVRGPIQDDGLKSENGFQPASCQGSGYPFTGRG